MIRETKEERQRNWELCEYFYRYCVINPEVIKKTQIHNTRQLYTFDAALTAKGQEVIICAIEGKGLDYTDISRGFPVKEKKVKDWRQFRKDGDDRSLYDAASFATQYTQTFRYAKNFQFFYVIRLENNRRLYAIQVTEELLQGRNPEAINSKGRPDPKENELSYIIEHHLWRSYGSVEIPMDAESCKR